MKGFGLFSTTTLLIAVLLLGALAVVLYMTSNLLITAPPLLTTTIITAPTSTIPALGNTTTISPPANSPNLSAFTSNQIIAFTLNEINTERAKFGLANVTLSNITSGQQHAESMLFYAYFSHWDPFGLKPYMRYTLLGGTQGVDENVAYNEQVNETCLGPVCSIRQINVTDAIARMNFQMLYNDSICCNNGHKNNTLDPNHNQISIGVAYNKTNVYLVEDFINNYIDWLNRTPGITASGQMIYLNGLTLHNSNFSFIQIDYDPTPQNLSTSALSATKSYTQGQPVAGVAYGPYYYQNVQTIYASTYTLKKNYFDVAFNLTSVTKNYGAGVYTVDLYLTNSTGGKFLATTYSIFINGAGQPYTPDNV
jgi:uncharacterized protein YkwD